MTSDRGEIRFDRPDLIRDATQIARTLDGHGVASFRYAAFGTGWQLLVIDQEVIPLYRNVHGGRTPNGIESGGYTLWLRDSGNAVVGAWLHRGMRHVPDYLREKFDTTLVDGYGIAVLVMLVHSARGGGPLRRDWADRVREEIRLWGRTDLRLDALPAFMDSDPDKGGT